MSQRFLDTEEIAIPDISHLVIEDDIPVDNFQSEKQQRLLVEPLYSSWFSGIPYLPPPPYRPKGKLKSIFGSD